MSNPKPTYHLSDKRLRFVGFKNNDRKKPLYRCMSCGTILAGKPE